MSLKSYNFLHIFKIIFVPVIVASFLPLHASEISESLDKPHFIGENLVKNGGFEMGNQYWEGDAAKLIGSTASKLAIEGKKAFLYKKKPKKRGWLSVYQNIQLKPGKTYSVTAKVYAPRGVVFGINLSLTENDNLIYQRGLKKDANALKEWQDVEVFFQIPKDLKNPNLKVSMNGGNSKRNLLLDDVQIYEVAKTEVIETVEKITLFTGNISMNANIVNKL